MKAIVIQKVPGLRTKQYLNEDLKLSKDRGEAKVFTSKEDAQRTLASISLNYGEVVELSTEKQIREQELIDNYNRRKTQTPKQIITDACAAARFARASIPVNSNNNDQMQILSQSLEVINQAIQRLDDVTYLIQTLDNKGRIVEQNSAILLTEEIMQRHRDGDIDIIRLADSKVLDINGIWQPLTKIN